MYICSIKLNGKGLKKEWPLFLKRACVLSFFFKKHTKIIKHFTNVTKVKGHGCKLGRLAAQLNLIVCATYDHKACVF